jgi:hypothetical protein
MCVGWVNLRSLLVISFNQNQGNCVCGLIVMGDLPKWKKERGLIVMGDLPKWKKEIVVSL